MTQIQEVRNKLIGSWSLISSRTEIYDSPDAEPSILYTIGKDAQGIIMFSPDGYVSTQLMRPGAIKWKSSNLLDGTTEELADAARHFLAYAGSFDVEARGDETLIYISVDLCSFANWLGDRQERVVRLEGDVLKLTPPSFIMQGKTAQPIFEWKKMSDRNDSNSGGFISRIFQASLRPFVRKA